MFACLFACWLLSWLCVSLLACLLVGSLARTLAYKLAVRLVAGLPVCDLVTYLNMIKVRRIPKIFKRKRTKGPRMLESLWRHLLVVLGSLWVTFVLVWSRWDHSGDTFGSHWGHVGFEFLRVPTSSYEFLRVPWSSLAFQRGPTRPYEVLRVPRSSYEIL